MPMSRTNSSSAAITSPCRASTSTASGPAAAPSAASTRPGPAVRRPARRRRGPRARPLTGGEASRPTVTDAQLVLGRLRPRGRSPAADGRSTSSLARARRRRPHVARPLGSRSRPRRRACCRLLDQQLFHAVQKISAERGYDRGKFILVAAGGAGPMHGPRSARKLQSPAVCVPRLAGAPSARFGMLERPDQA